MVDCAPNPKHCGGTGGCEGSTPELAFAYLEGMSGQASEEDYRYKGRDEACKFDAKTTPAIVSIEGF